jgi:EmrB/QacA subfamily drug resistance transporter
MTKEQKIKNDSINKNRWGILAVVLSLTFMACLDGSIVNIAAFTIRGSLGVDDNAIAWVVISYLTAITATVLIFGRLGDVLNKVSVFKFGVVLFTIGSLLCGLAGSLAFLIGARVIQGIGAAAFMATNQGIITEVFPAHERGRALGLTGSSVALGALVGPGLGGIMVSQMDWHWIFLINIPIGIAAFFVGQRILPKRHKEIQQPKKAIKTRKADLLGAGLLLSGMTLLFLAINLGSRWGFANPWILCMFGGASALAVTFFLVEKRHSEPILDLGIFKNRLYSLSVFCSFMSFVTMHFMLYILPFYLQGVLQISQWEAGLYMMAGPLVMMVVAPLSGYVSDKIGSEVLTFAGQCVMAAGLAVAGFCFTKVLPAGMIALFVAQITLGSAIFQSPNTSLIMSQVPREKLGISGSINALMRNMGMTVSVSLFSILLYFFIGNQIGYRAQNFMEGGQDVFISGLRGIFWVAALLCMVGVVLTGLRLVSKFKEKKRDKLA